MPDYLINTKQRTKINLTFSSWYDRNTGVPQGSILSPLPFNMFVNDSFFLLQNQRFVIFQMVIQYTVATKI